MALGDWTFGRAAAKVGAMALSPATDYRPMGLRALNRLFPVAWRAGVLPDCDLQEATITTLAVRGTRLSDFGDDAFARAQLRVLLPALRDEAALTPMGRVIAHGSILTTLRMRLWAEELFRHNPQILERPVAPPVVILGQMRSGTTRLHRLMASDRRFMSLKLYEAMAPVPGPASLDARARGRADPRMRYTRRAFAFLNYINPDIASVHPTGATEVDEELGLLAMSFSGSQLEAQWRVPSFARHGEMTDQTPAYAYLRRMLQLIGWFRGDDPSVPFVLKSPQHMQDLGALLNIFPDARLVFTHRDPARVVASGASLAWNQMVVQSDAVDPHWVGAEWLHKTILRTDVAEAQRKRLAPGQSFDIHYADMEGDWRSGIAGVYDFLGRPLDAATRAAMDTYITRAGRHHPHRKHRYAAQDFGLNPAAIDAAFAPYRLRYNVPLEPAPLIQSNTTASSSDYSRAKGVAA
jgi:hypothetical protein